MAINLQDKKKIYKFVNARENQNLGSLNCDISKEFMHQKSLPTIFKTDCFSMMALFLINCTRWIMISSRT